ncbi:HK97 family phage prohead protease [Sporichthya sp.]|uniref:HK97 family phage prohead protease n=1 Tax=Sporichthya sp. TaxID=65475 RepID=UPI0017E5A8A0|nr:HK97 family phage prohead protease [Sporichthya sp.]MBA3742496.1 HK97 family phage prohead protease [Sporichthya sp.]
MSNILRRACAPTDLEIRGDGRTIVGLAVPFDTPTLISGPGGSYTEVFRRGAFARTLTERGASRVKVFACHDSRALPLGRADVLREDAAGLYCELKVSQTAAGNEALELVRDGALDSLSVGFAPVRESRGEATGLVERTEVKLYEISLVAFPSYEAARILAVRSDLTPGGANPLLNRARHAQRLADLIRLEI